jgi:hypothetical protein
MSIDKDEADAAEVQIGERGYLTLRASRVKLEHLPWQRQT